MQKKTSMYAHDYIFLLNMIKHSSTYLYRINICNKYEKAKVIVSVFI